MKAPILTLARWWRTIRTFVSRTFQMRPLTWRMALDNICFALVVFGGELFILHGKAVADYIFTGGRQAGRAATNVGFDHWWIHLTCFAVACFFGALRTTSPGMLGITRYAPVALLCTAAAPVFIQRLSTWPSALVLSIQTFFLGVIGLVVIVEKVFDEAMSADFWKSFFEGTTRSVRSILALYTAGVAVLKFVALSRNPTAHRTGAGLIL